MLTEIACPNCLNPIDVRGHGRHVTCDACRSRFILQGHVCPACNAYHSQETKFCAECGQALTRVCQKCHAVNWTGDEYCHGCGASLDIFQLLHLHHKQATADRLNEQMEFARTIKAQEQTASDRRMAKMKADEAARLAEIARRRQAQKQKDKQMFIMLAVGILIVILLLGLVTVFFS